jgi:nitrogen fixation/metabolism regulation signal transduction histidine kinase
MPGIEFQSILGGVRRVSRLAVKPMRVFARGTSLRRRVAYSLAVVRLILVPVILLAIYYLFAMSSIVDRIVSVDAPVATFAEKASIYMLDARRSERNYVLLHDPVDLQHNHDSLAALIQIINTCRDLQPEEDATTRNMLHQVNLYQRRLEALVSRMGEPHEAPLARIEEVVRAYQKQTNELLRRARHESQTRLIDDLRNQVGSFDAQISATLETEDPALRQATADLQASSTEVLRLANELEKRSWGRVQLDHQEARNLKVRAEVVLLIVSSLTLILSVFVSFILPREVVKPLSDLKAAVDHAAAGNYEIEFDLQGDGEVVQLADSVRQLISHVREKKNSEVTARR